MIGVRGRIGQRLATKDSNGQSGATQAMVAKSQPSPVDRVRRGIGARLLIRVVLFSSAVTLVLTTMQLYLDYRRDVSIIDQRLNEIEHSHLASIGESLWQLDERQLALQLEGILRLPDISAVEVRESTDRGNSLQVAVGQPQTHSVIARKFPLTYAVRGTNLTIGTLYVEATLTGIYRELVNKAVVILVSQGTKTFLVSLFILYMLHNLVTRHLASMAGALSVFDPRRESTPLTLQRPAPPTPDELDQVVSAFNSVYARLRNAYDDLRAANQELARDNLARRRAETALRESEHRFRDYAETASDWFWETGPDHRFTYLSDRVADFGVITADLIGQRRWDAATDLEQDPEKWRLHFQSLDWRESFRDFTYQIRLAGNALGYVSTSGKPVFDGAGAFLGYRGVGRSVTAQVHAELALREAIKQAELANTAKSDFLANMSHELRTPLNAIIGLSEMIESEMLGPIGNEHYRGYAGDINASGRHLLGIINTILDLAKVEAGKMELQMQALPLDEIVLAVVRIMTTQAEAAGLHLETVISPDFPNVRADALAIRRILFNLISNAVKFTPRDGRITVSLQRTAAGEIELSVADTGIGIAAEHLPKLMQPFVQFDNVYQRKFQGAGLGLALVRSLVEPHGGTVTISSVVGQGTCVRVLLPSELVVAAATAD